MHMVGQSRGYRHYKPQSKRWMYQPKHVHKRKKIDWEDVALWLLTGMAMFVITVVVGLMWLYS